MSLLSKIPHEHKFKQGDSITADLKEGKFTQFIILKCWCGAKQGFPSYNLQIAFDEGTEETINLLKKMGFKEVEN